VEAATETPAQEIAAGEKAEAAKGASIGISILKEIFPNQASGEGSAPSKQMLLNSIPTPSRACASPLHALTSTTPLPPPSLAPVPLMPAPSCHHLGGSNYRERLRAGGREAFQRAYNAGLMPKAMKQDGMYGSDSWMGRHQFSQNNTPVSSPMSYSSVADGHAVWDSAAAAAPTQNADYWPNQMEHAQMLDRPQMMSNFGASHDTQQIIPQFQQAQFQQAWNAVAMQQAGQQQQQQAQLQLQLPQQQMQQMPVAVGSSPTELHRCMAIILPETAQFPCDKQMVAAQLQAAADCQYYED
jgi:hypothetical protein